MSEEDVEKALESKQKVIDGLSVENESYKKEIDELKARLAELDSHVDDAKNVPEEDTKNVEQADTKEVPSEDDKEADVQDEKKVSASKKKK